jgi:hypothetical protein
MADIVPWGGRAAESWAIGQALTGLVSGFTRMRAVRRLRRDRGSASPAPVEVRASAYADLRRAVVQVRLDLAVLGTAPTFVGSLWTVPVHLRLLRLLPDRLAMVLSAALDIEGVGNDEPIDLAEQLVLRLTDATTAFPQGRRRSARRAALPAFETALTAVDEALWALVLACRNDLGYG